MSPIGPTETSAAWGAVGETEQTIGAIQRLVLDKPGITVAEVAHRLSRRFSGPQVFYTINNLVKGPSAVLVRDEENRLTFKVGVDRDSNETRAKAKRRAA